MSRPLPRPFVSPGPPCHPSSSSASTGTYSEGSVGRGSSGGDGPATGDIDVGETHRGSVTCVLVGEHPPVPSRSGGSPTPTYIGCVGTPRVPVLGSGGWGSPGYVDTVVHPGTLGTLLWGTAGDVVRRRGRVVKVRVLSGYVTRYSFFGVRRSQPTVQRGLHRRREPRIQVAVLLQGKEVYGRVEEVLRRADRLVLRTSLTGPTAS